MTLVRSLVSAKGAINKIRMSNAPLAFDRNFNQRSMSQFSISGRFASGRPFRGSRPSVAQGYPYPPIGVIRALRQPSKHLANNLRRAIC